MHKNRFQAIFEYANEGILTTSERGLITSVNPSCCKLFGYNADELIGKPIEILIPRRFNNHRGNRDHYFEKPAARNMGQGRDLYGQHKDGEEIPVEVSLSPYRVDREIFVIAFIVDITSRKLGEERQIAYQEELENEVEDRTLILKEAIQKLEKTKENLDAALKREKELNSLKSKFVSIASHEFRTPLATLLSSLALVGKYGKLGKTDMQDKHINRMKGAVETLTEILDDILRINKLEDGKVKVQGESIVIQNFIENLLYDLKLTTKENQLIHAQYNLPVDVTVYLDKKLLRHIFTNLISNAIKFSAENTLIQVELSIENKELVIMVSDQGIGIPSENLHQLFDRFYRADNVGQIKGTGLGLNIVKQYTELLEGSVQVESVVGQGTKFTLKFPLKLSK